MTPLLVFFVVAALVGLAIRAVVALRLRAVAGRAAVTDDDLCQLRQASRISSLAVVASLVGVAVAGLAALVVAAG